VSAVTLEFVHEAGTWRWKNGDRVVEASDASILAGEVRAVVTVRQAGELVHRSSVKLTSERIDSIPLGVGYCLVRLLTSSNGFRSTRPYPSNFRRLQTALVASLRRPSGTRAAETKNRRCSLRAAEASSA